MGGEVEKCLLESGIDVTYELICVMFLPERCLVEFAASML